MWGLLFLTNNRNTCDLFDCVFEECKKRGEVAEIYCGRLDVEYLKAIKPKHVISYNYDLISQECIDVVNENIINMHISHLLWNRGFSPDIWSFIDDTPRGVTIHMLSSGLDEGDVLFQREAIFDANEETFETTCSKLNKMLMDLFEQNWGTIRGGKPYDTENHRQEMETIIL